MMKLVADAWRKQEKGIFEPKYYVAKRKEEHLEVYLAMLWAKPLGLWPTRADRMACKQVLGEQDGVLKAGGLMRPLFDHTYWLRVGRGGKPNRWTKFVIATHPYGVTERYKVDAGAYAERVGARVEYPEFPSWWNSDGCDAVIPKLTF